MADTTEENVGDIREIKLDVTWSCVKRQTAKMKLLWNFCRLSLALWTVEGKYLYLWRIAGDIFFIFMWFNEGLEVRGHLCRLPFDVRPRVTSSLISFFSKKSGCWEILMAYLERSYGISRNLFRWYYMIFCVWRVSLYHVTLFNGWSHYWTCADFL